MGVVQSAEVFVQCIAVYSIRIYLRICLVAILIAMALVIALVWFLLPVVLFLLPCCGFSLLPLWWPPKSAKIFQEFFARPLCEVTGVPLYALFGFRVPRFLPFSMEAVSDPAALPSCRHNSPRSNIALQSKVNLSAPPGCIICSNLGDLQHNHPEVTWKTA